MTLPLGPGGSPLAGVPGIRVAEATADQVPQIVALLADDLLGREREAGAAARYDEAFAAIDADPSEHLLVLLDTDDAVVGTLQLGFVRSLSRGGALRAQIEAVRVSAALRGRGVGRAFFQWVIGVARGEGAVLLQLTSDLQRAGAIHFYESLGFVHSHAGLKMPLTPA
ncbi:GNAT family N-acetyltransferase [Flexivirga oryzae]|uniref:GNAT superfamily N-acetyltransferase n=1 Tax=Flexivirga oryzae TaxID=1794944 RepID=A0A839N9Y1_9MICO|nr:GNAT family N-acetyltransferase [Flexivirga oryzae]MBB2892456.1 GNAT superfamily N-acetyltransferase [Flexivirga oryzae]